MKPFYPELREVSEEKLLVLNPTVTCVGFFPLRGPVESISRAAVSVSSPHRR